MFEYAPAFKSTKVLQAQGLQLHQFRTFLSYLIIGNEHVIIQANEVHRMHWLHHRHLQMELRKYPFPFFILDDISLHTTTWIFSLKNI